MSSTGWTPSPKSRQLRLIVAALMLPVSAAVAQQPPAPAEQMQELRASALEWSPLELPGFAPGLQLAVLNGNPEASELYTIRLRFPAGYSFPAHWHPMLENLTVVSGRFFLAMGDRTDKSKLRQYDPGDFLAIPARMAHFGRVEGETVIQLHGMGPFDVTVVETISTSR